MKNLYLIHLGIGHVGSELVSQIERQNEKISKIFGVNLVYKNKFTSKNSEEEINKSIQSVSLPFVIIDTTSSDKTTPYILSALNRGGFIVLANKRLLAGKLKDFQEIYKYGYKRILHETTVGAGLPVIETIRQMISTGDEIISINGCFSGTLGFICSEIEKGRKFSDAVFEAKQKGFTEFDPREDLSGNDVARKVLILARMMGKKIEPEQINIEPLYPKMLAKCSVEEFMEKVKILDEEYKEKVEKAVKKDKVLRFVAGISEKGCFAKLTEVEKKSAIGSLEGPDNIIVIKTKRYFNRPIIIQGQGAGVEVTAAGVFGDILLIVKSIGGTESV